MPHLRRKAALLVIPGLLFFACKTAPPPPPSPELPPTLRIPAGCEGDLSGLYGYSGRPDWQYLAQDDGGTLSLQLRRSFPDAGVTDESAARDGGVRIVLQRSPAGFKGAVEHVAFPAAGSTCRVSFLTEITRCVDGGITLASQETVAVDPSCATVEAEATHRTKTHELVPLPSPESF